MKGGANIACTRQIRLEAGRRVSGWVALAFGVGVHAKVRLARERCGPVIPEFPNSTRALNAAVQCSLVLFVEEGFQAGIACAADGKACAVREDCHFAVFAVGLDARDALEVDEVGAVDTYEESRVERQFEAA